MTQPPPAGSLPRDLGLGAAAGTVSGLLGVGGGVLLVPILVLAFRWQQKSAQATALVLVMMAAFAGVATYALADAVAWGPASIIFCGAVAGALVGSVVVQRVHPHWLQMAFGLVLVAAAVRLVWPTGATPESLPMLPTLSASLVLAYLASGLAMGFLSAMFGIGGGIILVPILVTLLDYDQRLAAGTSLAVMVPTALIGALRLTRPGYTSWGRGVRLGVGGVVGGLVGARLGLWLPVDVLSWAFALLLVIAAVQMFRAGLGSQRSVATAD